jgi:hypothetical protein
MNDGETTKNAPQLTQVRKGAVCCHKKKFLFKRYAVCRSI